MKPSTPGGMERQKSFSHHYQTFPTPPPKSRGKPPMSPSGSSGYDGSAHLPQDSCDVANDQLHMSPLPTTQLVILAVIALAEQTALYSISPYLPQMASTFPDVNVEQVGLYVGLIASSFALAQIATSFFWGWLSDHIGRKPVIMLGTTLTIGCFCAFGFCRTLWQAIIVQTLMGMVNGNQGVVSTFLGEIKDKSNQRKAFVYLPMIYGIGAVTGPAIGGLLVMENSHYPYLLPNMLSAVILGVDLILTAIFLEESLEEARELPPLKKRVGKLFSWLWQFMAGARSPTYLRRHFPGYHDSRPRVDGVSDLSSDDETTADDEGERQSLPSIPEFFPHHNGAGIRSKDVLNGNTIILLSTYMIFQLSNVSFNSLYPIFAFSPAPSGRELSSKEIGLSQSFTGIATILFQIGIFGKLIERFGNKVTYRVGLFGFFIAMMIIPWVGYRESPPPLGIGSGKVWLWIGLYSVLLIKTVATAGGLASALLLITNSAPNHSVLRTLNGLAQTLSAAGRAAGPFLSGGLFSLATRVRPKGEALAWGVFGGIAFVGFMASFAINADSLESREWDNVEDDEDD